MERTPMAQRRIVLRDPYPTAEEVAKAMKIPAQRAKELDRMMEDYFLEERMRLGSLGRPRRGQDGRSKTNRPRAI
jgi:hypothetical protein